MFEKIENWFIKRNLKRRRIFVHPDDISPNGEFKRVLNTLRENHIMVETRKDGVYIRLAGNRGKSEINTSLWAKVVSF